MARSYAVIGANFGDEGKGVVTHYLASQDPKTLIVRYCGGAQAGHTVVLSDGRRHIFHQYGSGTLAGCETYLSQFFIFNPILFVRERAELVRLLGASNVPTMYLCKNALVTTPYDMLINRGVEAQRGAGRHGSCGLGINETVVRCEDPEYRLTVDDALDTRFLRQKLRQIRHEWLPQRLEQHGMSRLPAQEAFWASKDHLLDNFVADCTDALNDYRTVCTFDIWATNRPVIFEGAQGLWLDEVNGYFPHVTRARTGMSNVRELCQAMGVKLDSVYYVTRPYFTRHGAGPLPGEVVGLPYAGIQDETNVPNPHQGPMRFGLFDSDHFKHGLDNDRQHIKDETVRLAVTCLDHIGPSCKHTTEKGVEEMPTTEFLRSLNRLVGAEPGLVANGPTAEHVTDVAAARLRTAE